MKTIREFIRESARTDKVDLRMLMEQDNPVPSEEDAPGFSAEELARQAAPEFPAAEQLYRNNSTEIVQKVMEVYNDGDAKYLRDDVESVLQLRWALSKTLQFDADAGFVYPWHTALYIRAYQQGTWDLGAYLTYSWEGALAVLSQLPIASGLTSAAYATTRAVRQDLANWTATDYAIAGGTGLAAGVGAVMTGILKHVSAEIVLRFIGKQALKLPLLRGWPAYSNGVLKGILNDDKMWSELVTALRKDIQITEESRLFSPWLSIKGFWTGYEPGNFKPMLTDAIDSINRVINAGEGLVPAPSSAFEGRMALPVYTARPGAGVSRDPIGYIYLDGQALLNVPDSGMVGSDTAFSIVTNLSRQILRVAYQRIGPGGAALDVSGVMEGKKLATVLDGASGVDTTNFAKLVDAAESSDDVWNSHVAEVAAKATRSSSANIKAGAAFLDKEGNPAQLPSSFFVDAGSVPESATIRESLKNARAKIIDFAKFCEIPLNNLTILGKILITWRQAVAGTAVYGSLVLAAAAGVGLSKFIDAQTLKRPEGIKSLKVAASLADAKVRDNAVSSWGAIRLNQSMSLTDDVLALALAGEVLAADGTMQPVDAEANKELLKEADAKLADMLDEGQNSPYASEMPDICRTIAEKYRDALGAWFTLTVPQGGPPGQALEVFTPTGRGPKYEKVMPEVLRHYIRDLLR